MPDAKTIWLFREYLVQAGAIENLFSRYDRHLSKAGYLAMGEQIVDATIVAAPRQRNTDAEKTDLKAGKIPDDWKARPAKLRQKDRDALTHAAAYDGAQLRNVVRRPNTDSTVRADTAYRSKRNEAWLEKNGFISDIHHKKPKGRSMSEATARANGRRSKIRSRIEHVFAHQKSRMGMFVRTIGIARAIMKIGMVNLAYNISRYVWHEKKAASA